ncbi:MAG: FAD-binding protein [Candidatus Korobacteraceae bacterium]|jgi:fumarate reductase (CoM/CoB) subunit A
MALSLPVEEVTTDVLVIGAGGAGIVSALTCAEGGLSVLLTSKGAIGSGSTFMARGGYAAATGYPDPKDNPDVYFEDVLKVGYGLNDPELVRVMVRDINPITEKLDSWGMDVVRDSNGRLSPKLRPGHSFPRTIHKYDATGPAIINCLRQRLATESKIRAVSHLMICDLLVENNTVCAAWGVDVTNSRIVVVRPAITILAAGGGGQLYTYTDNSKDTVGDGYALAFNAGCQLIDMEMVEFQLMVCHPERLMGYAPNSSSLLMNGGRLYNGLGERFLIKYGIEEANSNRSARIAAVGRELFSGNITAHGGVYMDLSSAYSTIEKTNPSVTKVFKNAGLNLSYQPLEMTLGVHTFLGGVRINKHAETCVSGLLAAGEIAGGIHGANRLPNGALADALAFGYRAGLTAMEKVQSQSGQALALNARDALPFVEDKVRFYSRELSTIKEIRASIRDLCSKYFAVVRAEDSLNQGLQKLAALKDGYHKAPSDTILSGNGLTASVEVYGMLTLAETIARAALLRRESRGCHFRLDYPTEDKTWLKNIVLTKQADGIAVDTIDVGDVGRRCDGASGCA